MADIILQETVGTSTDGPVTLRYLLRGPGVKQMEIERLSPWSHGYQTASLHVPRPDWPACTEQLRLDSERQLKGIFTLRENWEEAVITLHHNYHGFGSSEGRVKITIEAVPDEDIVGKTLFGQFGIVGAYVARAALSAGANLSDKQQPARVQIVGGHLGLLSHWVVLFDFETDGLFTCELTAQDSEGNMFGVIDCGFNCGSQSVDDFVDENGYCRFEHESISIVTSPRALQSKCSTHPLNGTMYDLIFNNCQDWIWILLVQGYNVDPVLLPLSSFAICRNVEPISNNLGPCIALFPEIFVENFAKPFAGVCHGLASLGAAGAESLFGPPLPSPRLYGTGLARLGAAGAESVSSGELPWNE